MIECVYCVRFRNPKSNCCCDGKQRIQKKTPPGRGQSHSSQKWLWGEDFDLTGEEIVQLVITEAENLPEFAKKLLGTERL